MFKPTTGLQFEESVGRTNRASLTAVNELMQNGTGSLVALLITPYIAHTLGFEQYGIWLMVFQLLGYITWADLSPGSALKLSLVTRQHEADGEPKRRLISASMLVALMNFPIYLLGWFLLYRFMPLLLGSSMEWLSSACVTMTILLFGAFISNFFGVFSNVLRAMNSAYRAMGLRTLVLVGFGIAQVWVVRAGLGMPGLAILRILGELAIAVLLFNVARETFSWFGFNRPNKQDVLGLLKFSPGLFLSYFGYTLFQSSDLLVIGWILGPTAAAAYSLTRTLPLLADRWLRPVVLSATAGMGDLFGRAEIARLAEVRIELHMIVLLLASIFGVLALILNRSFVGLWIGSGQFAGLIPSALLVLAIALSLFSVNDMTLLDMCGYLGPRVLWYTLCGLLVVFCSVLIGKSYGVAGVAGAVLVGQLFLMFGVQVMVIRTVLSADLFVQYFRAIGRPLVLVGIIYLTVYAIGSKYLFPSWAGLTLVAVLTGICSAGLMWFVGFAADQRRALRARLAATIRTSTGRTG